MSKVTMSLTICQSLFYLLIWANKTQFNLRSWFIGIKFYCLLVTSGRNWPSGPQEEVFKRVGTLHSRVLGLKIKRRHLLTEINCTHEQIHMLEYQSIRAMSSHHSWNPLHSHHYAIVSFSCYTLKSKKAFCNSQQSPTSLWLGQTSTDWLLTTYCSGTYHWIWLSLSISRVQSWMQKKLDEAAAFRH